MHVSHAKVAATDAAQLTSETAIQVHGAMGYTYEVDLHFWMKRSWALAGAWGDRSFHVKRIDSAVFDGWSDEAVAAAAFGAFMHQGQICMSAGRHLVHEQMAPVYAQRMAEKARALPMGNPHTDPVAIGPLIKIGRAHV